MKKNMLIVLLLFFCSCAQYKGSKRISFKSAAINKKIIVMNIPKHSSMSIEQSGGEVGKIHKYIFADSAIIYIQTGLGIGTPNDSLILALKGWAPSKKIFCDTATFYGVDANGKHWKEIKYVGVIYGYNNIKPELLQEFEASINSVKRKINYKIVKLSEFCSYKNEAILINSNTGTQ